MSDHYYNGQVRDLSICHFYGGVMGNRKIHRLHARFIITYSLNIAVKNCLTLVPSRDTLGIEDGLTIRRATIIKSYYSMNKGLNGWPKIKYKITLGVYSIA